MTDGLEAARRSEVAKSFRYARAFYDEAEAAGPAEFERNRQAIIDVIALAYRDGRASARAGESALRAAAQELVRARRLAGRCARGVASTQEGNQLLTLLNHLKAALDGAPWEPSEEQVEQALSGWFSALPNWREQLSLSANAVSDLQSRARAALKAAMGIESGSAG